MGLLDKVKAQATAATEIAKDAAQKGQAKLNDMQNQKGADGILRDLGAAYYATQTGRATPTTEADITRLVAALQSHEATHGALTLAPETPAAAPTAAPTGSAPPPPPTAVTTEEQAQGGTTAAATPPPPPPAPVADPATPPPPPPTAQTL
jgi:hypothetical protein